MSSVPSRPARLAVLLTLAASALLLAPAPAEAHPFGPPQTVEVEPAADGVRVQWRVGGTDDLTLLAISLGVLPQDRMLLDGAVVFEDADATTLAAAPELSDYLLAHVEVTTGGTPCAGQVAVTGDLVGDGVELTYDCGAPVAAADVSVTTLTDLHPAYRTLATGPDGQRAVYDAESPRHEWALGEGVTTASSDDDLGASAVVQIGAVLGGLLVVGLGALGWVRRRA